jgi:hypothetical protein
MSIFSRENTETESKFAPQLKPGERVKLRLKSYGFVKDKDGDSTEDFELAFKGTEEGNTGEFRERVFANNFDEKDEKYSETWGPRNKVRLAHIITAIIPEDIFFKCFEKTDDLYTGMKLVFKEFDKLKNENGEVAVDLIAKVTYVTRSNKYYITFPNFPDFIKSELNPTRDWATDAQYDIYEKPELPNDEPNDIDEIDPTNTDTIAADEDHPF